MNTARLLFLGMFVVGVLTTPAFSQVQPLTVERIWGSEEFDTDLVSVRWASDGRSYTETEENDDLTDLYQVDVATGERVLLVRGSDLVPPGTRTPIDIEEYEFSPDRSKLLIFTNSIRVWRRNTKGEYYIWDINARRLTPISAGSGYQQYAKFSPDGRLVGFVRDHNIFVTDIATGSETQLTTDGNDNIINGASDWVYEEELGLRDAFRFSPDGRRIAFWRIDQTVIKPFYMIDETELYPELVPVRYPKAGEQNSEVRIGVVDITVGRTTWMNLGEEEDIYVAEVGFAGSADEIWLTRLNRHQNRLDLMLANVLTGESRVIMADADEAWVDAHTPTWIDGGRQYVYRSDRDGYSQLFLFDRDGALVRKLTTEEWDVLNVVGVDDEDDVVYFTAAADGPLQRPLYRVGLNGSGLHRVSVDPGTHSVTFDPTFEHYIDTYSRAWIPPVRTLRTAGGALVRTISSHEVLQDQLQSLGLRPPEFIKIPIEGGEELNALLIKPPDFDPSRRHPLLMYVYGGPGSQTVTDSWGGARYLWHQMLAQQGYLVASVDNRGTGARGARFKKMTYLNLGRYESADQIAAARYFGALPYVDESRIGIWGWSYGGYMSSLSMLKGGDVFRAAISVAPVTDWRLYDTIYTERYMRTPQENPGGYREGAPLNYAGNLQGKLLLVHGTGDDNVHSQQTLQLVEALEEANKQFDMRLYPNKTHSIAGEVTRVNLYTLLTSWLEENLYGQGSIGHQIP
jgi:dipeptidyl-peptidase-4